MAKHHTSVFINEQECLKALLEIHNDGNDIDCDPMYFKGGFYKCEVQRPQHIFDIKPRVDYCLKGNAESLAFKEGSMASIILDPLFMFGSHGKTDNHYSSKTMGILKDFNELERHYKAILKEAYRLLVNNGLCLFKCQDYTDSKTTMTHCMVYRWATEQGFYAQDLAILNIPKHKVYNGNTKQRHLRKTHAYFWVFRKKRTNRGKK